MATSNEIISLDHLADHLIYLTSSSSFWFSLNSDYDHDFYLSKRLGMTPKDYEYLLVAADLAHFHKRWGFSIKIMKWKFFLEGHRFTTINCDGTFEVDTKKMDLNAFIEGTPKINKERLYFLRIDILKASSHRRIDMQKDPNDGRMINTPPRLGGLHLQQTIFRRLIEPILWNYFLDNALPSRCAPPPRCCRRRAAAKLPPTSRCRAAATAAAAATVPPFIGWFLRFCPSSDFVIACRHAAVNALVAGRFRL